MGLFNTGRAVNPKMSPSQRKEVCEGGFFNPPCGFFDSKTRRCKDCGCFIDAKVKIATEKCPQNKWK
jgi:hypothetical protein